MKNPALYCCCLLLLLLPSGVATPVERYLARPREWFASSEGKQITANVLSWQSEVGSWPKNTDTTRQPYTGDAAKLQGTFDNGATTGELRFLARAFDATNDPRCREAALKAIDLLLKAQYPTGGWPQFYPPPAKTYHRYITFNDGSMVRILETLRTITNSADFAFVDAPRRDATAAAFQRGIDCILKSQIKIDGRLTVWCAQHDEVTLEPRPARSYELVSLSGGESAGILRFLMSLDNPSPTVRQSIQAGVDWYAANKITGLRLDSDANGRKVVADASAKPLWARFYDLKTGRPMFVDRDGIPHETMAEVGKERRNGYSWYGNWGESVAKEHAKWLKKWGPMMPSSGVGKKI